MVKLEKKLIKDLIIELELNPIKNVPIQYDKWGDCNSFDPPNNVSQNDGKIRSLKDFINIIEFIYRYKLLKPLMAILLGKE